MNKNIKKVSALVGVLGSIGGIGVGIASANDSSAATPTYHWYKIYISPNDHRFDSDPNNPSVSTANQRELYDRIEAIIKARYYTKTVNGKQAVDDNILFTRTNVESKGLKSQEIYYRATTPIAGGITASNTVAYDAWKKNPNTWRVIYVNDSKSKPNLGIYTYYFWKSYYDTKTDSHENFTNAPKWN